MSVSKAFISFPSGSALFLSIKHKPTSCYSHGAYRMEFDSKSVVGFESIPNLISSIMSNEENGEIIVGIHSRTNVLTYEDQDKYLFENNGSYFYSFKNNIRGIIKDIFMTPYGEISIIKSDRKFVIDKLKSMPLVVGSDDIIQVLIDDIDWMIGYDIESTILTIVSSKINIFMDKIYSIIKICVESYDDA